MADIMFADTAADLRILAGASASMGVFDGVHRGHRQIISALSAAAVRRVVVTFDVDPDELLRPGAVCKIMANDERLAALAALGVDDVLVFRFTREFCALSPEEFLGRMFAGNVPLELHVGVDFRFGCKGAGDAATLREWGNRHGMRVVAHELLEYAGAPVTSTRIRAALAQGDDDLARELLGR